MPEEGRLFSSCPPIPEFCRRGAASSKDSLWGPLWVLQPPPTQLAFTRAVPSAWNALPAQPDIFLGLVFCPPEPTGPRGDRSEHEAKKREKKSQYTDPVFIWVWYLNHCGFPAFVLILKKIA